MGISDKGFEFADILVVDLRNGRSTFWLGDGGAIISFPAMGKQQYGYGANRLRTVEATSLLNEVTDAMTKAIVNSPKSKVLPSPDMIEMFAAIERVNRKIPGVITPTDGC